jgi:hypothetical protein
MKAYIIFPNYEALYPRQTTRKGLESNVPTLTAETKKKRTTVSFLFLLLHREGA